MRRDLRRVRRFRSQGDGSLIVVIDDLEDIRHLIGATLIERGYRVLKAANGEEDRPLWNRTLI